MNLKISNDSILTLGNRYTTTYVIKKGYFNLVRCLLCLGADPNYVDEKEINNRTSLIYTTFIKDNRWAENVAYTLLEHGADLKKSDSKGLTPIHYCCTFGRDALLKIFLQSVDFDLSCSLDLNGNSCMHYAIGSGNVKCVNLLIRKFTSSSFTKKINLENRFGLKPIDIHNEEFVTNIEECKQCLVNQINLSNKIKIGEFKAKLEAEAALREKSKLKKKKTKKTKNFIHQTAKNVQTNTQKDNKTDFFPTQLNESEFLDKFPKKKYSKQTSNLINNSNFNHFIGKAKVNSKKEFEIPKIIINEDQIEKSDLDEINLCNDFQSSIFFDKSQAFDLKLESVEPMQKNESIKLTFLSFLLVYKDFIVNLIEYNDLFFAKEHMLKDGLTYKLCRIERPKSELSKPKCQNNESNWKKSLPNVFAVYEAELSSSFRHSIRPPVIKKVKSNKNYYEDLKAKAKLGAQARKKQSKIVIVRNSLFNKLASSSQFSISPESYSESSVFEEESSNLRLNGRTSNLSILPKRKES